MSVFYICPVFLWSALVVICRMYFEMPHCEGIHFQRHFPPTHKGVYFCSLNERQKKEFAICIHLIEKPTHFSAVCSWNADLQCKRISIPAFWVCQSMVLIFPRLPTAHPPSLKIIHGGRGETPHRLRILALRQWISLDL